MNTTSFDTLRITGNGEPEDFHRILRKVTYKNKCRVPTPGVRVVRIVSKSGQWPLPTFSVNIDVKPAIWPEILIKGCKDLARSLGQIRNFGVPVCRKFKVGGKGCNEKLFLDSIEVSVKPAMKKGEFLMFPKSENHGTILDDYGMKIYNGSDGIVIRGVADAEAYRRVLQDMVYVNRVPNSKLRRQFFVSN